MILSAELEMLGEMDQRNHDELVNLLHPHWDIATAMLRTLISSIIHVQKCKCMPQNYSYFPNPDEFVIFNSEIPIVKEYFEWA